MKNEEECGNCGHKKNWHPYDFLCEVEECRCPGWKKKVPW